MFPIIVKHVCNIKYIKPELANGYITAIGLELKNLKVDKIIIEGARIDFKNYIFNGQGRNHLMSGVDKGYFELDIYSQKLTYSYSTLRMFWVTLVMSIFFGCLFYSVSGFIGGGLLAFLWLYGMNWVLSYIRHRVFLNIIANKI